MSHEVADIDEGGILQLLFGEQRTALKVILVQLAKHPKHLHTVVHFEQPHHLAYSHSLVGGMGGNFIKEDVVDVD